MMKNALTLSFLLLLSTVIYAAPKEKTVNVMTFNIRMDNQEDGINNWKFRKEYAANLIKFHDADIVGAQEVLNNQFNDLIERLPAYNHIGVGRTDGKKEGEACAIFFRKDRFKIYESGTFWLSEDINAIGVKGWDAACERIATWAILEDNNTGKKFFFLNTHLDHKGVIARREGAKLILRKTKELSKGFPIIVTGDFNATKTDEPIQIITDEKNPEHLSDSKENAELKYGPEWTCHNFGRTPLKQRPIIDYLFIKGNFTVLKHGVLSENMGTLYPSDHSPVMATILIK